MNASTLLELLSFFMLTPSSLLFGWNYRVNWCFGKRKINLGDVAT